MIEYNISSYYIREYSQGEIFVRCCCHKREGSKNVVFVFFRKKIRTFDCQYCGKKPPKDLEKFMTLKSLLNQL